MRRFLLGLVVVVAIGCGGKGGDAPDPLVGTWALESNGCTVGYTFSAAAAYEFDLVCPLNGALTIETEVGSYGAATGRITFTVSRTTCAGDLPVYALEYSFPAADRLSLTFADGLEVLAKTTPTGTGAATFGCWRMGAFTAGPLAPL